MTIELGEFRIGEFRQVCNESKMVTKFMAVVSWLGIFAAVADIPLAYAWIKGGGLG